MITDLNPILYFFKMRLTYEDLDAIPYFDEKGTLVSHMSRERDEQIQAREHVPEDGHVLELGGRYGTVSCSINVKLNDPTKHIAIEPDANVISSLIRNKEAHFASFTIFNGVISKSDMIIANPACEDKYGLYTTTQTTGTNANLLPRMTLQELEEAHNIQFDCLVADCEGGLGPFFEDNAKRLKDFRVVMYEKDYPNLCDYNKIETCLREWGFQCIVNGFHSVWKKPKCMSERMSE